ncbi:MAG: FHA domain-containing protein [Candidatus Thiodiazotropha sp.]
MTSEPTKLSNVALTGRSSTAGATLPITVKYQNDLGREQVRVFSSAFVIGRDPDCGLCIGDDCVSRRHVQIVPEGGVWFIRDLESSNGSYLDNRRITAHRMTGNARLQLGNQGPTLNLEIQAPEQRAETTSHAITAEEAASRYIDPGYEGPMGDHTRMVRRAVVQVAKKQSRVYLYAIGLIGVFLLGALGYATYQQYRLEQLEALTVDIFYSMKEVELQVAKLETANAAPDGAGGRGQLAAMRARLAQMESQYDAYLGKGWGFSGNMSEEDRLILRVARIFGECEVNLPDGFVEEVKKYIAKWQSSNRLAKAIERASLNGYNRIVKEVMLDHYLPPQFFYLALQESDYKRNVVGPKTRYGIAKGIWQFIPSTANRYGLRTGPLLEVAGFDPKDERFDFQKATLAAASYIREIYTTDAQASGLLVMASYNWGERRIVERIHEMPENPRDRNFWQLLKKHQIPHETYDYVYYIFSAAVIGENPRLFGFDFDNPLAPLLHTESNSGPRT